MKPKKHPIIHCNIGKARSSLRQQVRKRIMGKTHLYLVHNQIERIASELNDDLKP